MKTLPKIKKVMGAFKAGSKNGAVVKNKKQALAVGYSEARKGKK